MARLFTKKAIEAMDFAVSDADAQNIPAPAIVRMAGHRNPRLPPAGAT
jgi:hypothetical protein